MDHPNKPISSDVHQAGPQAILRPDSQIGRRHPEEHPVEVGNPIDILQNSSMDHQALQRLADEGWHSLAAIPKYPSAPSSPPGQMDRQSVDQPGTQAHCQGSDVAAVGTNARATGVHQSSNQSNPVAPGLKTTTTTSAGAVATPTTSASIPGPKNVQPQESNTVVGRTSHNRNRSRGSSFSKRRGGGQGGQSINHNNHNTLHYYNRDTRTRLSQQPINFVKARSRVDQQPLTSPTNNHHNPHSHYHSQSRVIKTTTSTTGTVPPIASQQPTNKLQSPTHHPQEIESTPRDLAEPTAAEQEGGGKQSHGDKGSRVSRAILEMITPLTLRAIACNNGQPCTSIGADQSKQTITPTVDTVGHPNQEVAITSLNEKQPEEGLHNVDRNLDNNAMAYGRNYPSGPQSRGASAASPSARDGNQPFTARRPPDPPRTGGRGGYVPQRGRGSYNNIWIPPHLRKEAALKESPPEGNAPALRVFENSSPASRESELTQQPSNTTGYPDAGNVPRKPGQQQTPETVSGALGGEGSRPAEDDAKEKKANDADVENVQVIDKQGPGSSPKGPAWETKTATPTKILVHHGPKPNQTTPKDVRDQAPKVNNRSARWATKEESKPSKVSPPVSVGSDGSWPSNETVRSIDCLRNWNGGWAPAPIEWETRPGWKDRNMTEHLNTWLESSPAGDALDVRTHEFQSGVGTVNGKVLVAPPEEEVTLPNPEKSDKAGQTSNTAMLMKRIRWLERRLHQREKALAQSLASKGPIIYAPDIPENPHAPRANIYLRHGVPADLAACKDIYNHYCTASVVVQDRVPISEEKIRDQYADVRGTRLPWIVAVERGPNSDGYESAGKDKIVGYAFAEDYGGPNDSYRYTVEIQVFTHHNHLRMGVGKTLIDRLLMYLDPSHILRGGYDFIENDDAWGAGGQRVISKVLCNIPYTVEDNSEMKWLRKWLEGFDFDDMGTLKGVGLKFDKWLNVLYMQKNTGSSISLVNVN